MAKPEKISGRDVVDIVSTKPVKKAGDTKPEVKADRVVDNKANAKKFRDEWVALKKKDSTGQVHIPGSSRSVKMKQVEVVDNVTSVWTSSDTDLPPDFVIVNGPTEVILENGILVEDPLTAIAIAIDGATK